MTYLFYTYKLPSDDRYCAVKSIDPVYTVELWRPRGTSIVPPKFSAKPFAVWWLFHQFRIFENRDYAVLTIFSGNTFAHRSVIFPGYFRYPFMAADDLQIGDTWTVPDHRNKGLSTHAIHQILQFCWKPGRRFWYVAEKENMASIRTIEKVGFRKAGEGRRTTRFGLSLFGSFDMTHVI